MLEPNTIETVKDTANFVGSTLEPNAFIILVAGAIVVFLVPSILSAIKRTLTLFFTAVFSFTLVSGIIIFILLYGASGGNMEDIKTATEMIIK